METSGATPSLLAREDLAAIPPLDAAALERFLAGGAPSLAVALDPRVPRLPVAEALGAALVEPVFVAPARKRETPPVSSAPSNVDVAAEVPVEVPAEARAEVAAEVPAEAPVEGSRIHIVTALPGDGRSTVALQVAVALAASTARRVALWTPVLGFDVEAAAAFVATCADGGTRAVLIVDDAETRLEALFHFVRDVHRARGKAAPLDLLLFAEAQSWARGGGETRPWGHYAAAFEVTRGASFEAARHAGDEARPARERRRVASALARVWNINDPGLEERLERALGDGPERALGEVAHGPENPDQRAAHPAAPEGPLFRAVRSVLVGDEDAWRARAARQLEALATVEVQGRPAREVLTLIALPVLLGLPGVPVEVLAEILGSSAPGDSPDPAAPVDSPNARVPDARVPDARVPDARVPDAGVPDAGVPDAGVPDARVPDARVPDARVPDAGVPNAGVPDAGVPTARAPIEPDAFDALGALLAPLADVVPLRSALAPSGERVWTTRHPIVAGAWIDVLVDEGAEVLRASAQRLIEVAQTRLAANDAARGEAPRPVLARTARLASALARPPEAVRWLLDDTGAEDLAITLAEFASARAARLELHTDLITALRRGGRAADSCAAARAAFAAATELEGTAEHLRRLALSWAISELRRGGEGALARCVAVQLLALSDDLPTPRPMPNRDAAAADEALPRGPFEVVLRTLAWLAPNAREGRDAPLTDAELELATLLEPLAPFRAADPPERHELDEGRARIEVTRPEQVPFEPEGFGELLAALDARTRDARAFESARAIDSSDADPDAPAPLRFSAAVRVYRRFVAARVGPLVRILPKTRDSAGALLPNAGDLLQDAFEGWLDATGVKPYEAQMEAYFSIYGDSSVLLNTPTGSGKSLVALAAHFAALGRGERSVYTAPTKALVNEKFFDLCRRFGSANVGLLTGDASVNRDAPIVCCTAEILSNLAQVEGAARPFGWVVMDEFHYFSDKERGIAWLLPLMLLDGARFLLMSATIGEVLEAQTLVQALTGQAFELVRSTNRPVPLVFSYKVASEREALNELRENSLLPGYVVCVTRNDAAEKALAEPSSGGWSSKSVELPEHVFTSPFGRQLKRALRAGIGLHHSGLLPKYRRLVETLSGANELHLIFGTDTLGVGVNLPIRTVLFPQLVRNSGRNEYVRLDAARFQQLAGRAGRAGYATKSGDPQGDVWVLAPEDEVERQKAAAKAAAKGGKVKKAAPKSARPGPKMPSWSEATMQNLVASPARALEVRFEASAALVMNFVRRGESGIARLRALIDGLPLKLSEREALLLEVQRVLDTLVARREVRALEPSAAAAVADDGDAASRPPTAFAVGERSGTRREAGEDAAGPSFDRPLLRFLHDVCWDFVRDEDGPALDLLSLVESIVDDPRVVLGRQAKKVKDELWQAHREQDTDAFDQTARRDFQDERAEAEHPQPLKDEIDTAFDRWDEEHPGLTRQMPSAKSIVRDMFELGMGFKEYVLHYGLTVVEGELLRHLSEVWRVLAKGLPPGRDIERGTKELTEWLGALVRHVDSSLLDEWERLDDPDRAAAAGEPEPSPLPYDVTTNPRAFTRMVRNAAFRWVQRLAARRYDELVSEHVTVEALAESHRVYLDECGRLDLGAAARSPSLCAYEHGSLRVEQTLADPEGFHEWSLVGVVDVERSREEGDAVLVLRRLERKGFGFAEED